MVSNSESVDNEIWKMNLGRLLVSLQDPESHYQMALRSVIETYSQVDSVAYELSVFHDRFELTKRFRNNFSLFTGIELPRKAHALEIIVAKPEAIIMLFPYGKETDAGDWLFLSEEDVRHVAPWILNVNALHFLSYARPGKFSCTIKKLSYFEKFVGENGFKSYEVILDSSILLELYGIRRAVDIDYLALRGEYFSMPGISAHDGQISHHALSKKELITNPDFNFKVNDFQVISFAQLKRFKRNRNSKKDRHDVAMMQAVENGDIVLLLLHRVKYEISYLVRKTKFQVKSTVMKTIDVLVKRQ